MGENIKYVHTNLIARDWRKLAQFYIDVFDCKPGYPDRDLSGEWVDKLTTLRGAKIKRTHLILPGYENGPTLEIFSYSPDSPGEKREINSHGLGHIAFLVDSVEEVTKRLISHGGRTLGEIIEKDYGDMGILNAVYAMDPEGNFVEIQNWK